jgi:hypothetical protein
MEQAIWLVKPSQLNQSGQKFHLIHLFCEVKGSWEEKWKSL